MTRIELAPEDLTASYIGQYIKISLVRPLDDGTQRETLLIGALIGVNHKVDEYGSRKVETYATVDVAVNDVPIYLPAGGTVAVAETVDELLGPESE